MSGILVGCGVLFGWYNNADRGWLGVAVKDDGLS